jgi:hypothetical protein
VRKEVRGGKVVVTRTIISDGSAADVVIQREGAEAVTQPAGVRELRSLDKLATYRKMLESGTATVTARVMKDGVEIYTVRAVVHGLGGGEFDMVTQAEVRASDYLPLSYSAAFVSPDGKKRLQLSSRTFSKFERLRADELPADWFQPKASGKVRSDDAGPAPVKI